MDLFYFQLYNPKVAEKLIGSNPHLVPMMGRNGTYHLHTLSFTLIS